MQPDHRRGRIRARPAPHALRRVPRSLLLGPAAGRESPTDRASRPQVAGRRHRRRNRHGIDRPRGSSSGTRPLAASRVADSSSPALARKRAARSFRRGASATSAPSLALEGLDDAGAPGSEETFATSSELGSGGITPGASRAAVIPLRNLGVPSGRNLPPSRIRRHGKIRFSRQPGSEKFRWRSRHAAALDSPRPPGPHGNEVRVRRGVCVSLRSFRRRDRPFVPAVIPAREAAGRSFTTIEGLSKDGRHPASALDRGGRGAVRLLPAGDDHGGERAPARKAEPDRPGHRRRHVRARLPVRHLPPHAQGDPPRREAREGEAMSAITTRVPSNGERSPGHAALVLEFPWKAEGEVAGPRRRRRRSPRIHGSRSTPPES